MQCIHHHHHFRKPPAEPGAITVHNFRTDARSGTQSERVKRDQKSEPLESDSYKTISCGGEFSHACGAFCAPAFADPFPIFSCPKRTPVFEVNDYYRDELSLYCSVI